MVYLYYQDHGFTEHYTSNSKRSGNAFYRGTELFLSPLPLPESEPRIQIFNSTTVGLRLPNNPILQ